MRHYEFRSLRSSTLTAVLAVMLIGLSILAVVSAIPPPSNLPIAINDYGVVAVYASESTQANIGTIKINVASNGGGAFFLVRLLVYLNIAQQSDLTLSTLSIDSFYTLTLSQYYSPQSPKVVVIPSGFTMGDVVGAIQCTSQPNNPTCPTYLAPLLTKDPLGNSAIVLNGGAGNGITVQLTFSNIVTTTGVGTEAIVVAPSNDTITVSIS